MSKITGIYSIDQPEDSAIQQLERCLEHPSAVAGALMADHHKGYSMPIGGVVAYTDHLSPSGVGFDIGCGNCSMRTPLTALDVLPDIKLIMDQVACDIEFGIGRRTKANEALREHPIFEHQVWSDLPSWISHHLKDMARSQLGTVGGGNHYVNIMADEEDRVWVCNHFGSRGLGHNIATGYMNMGKGDPYDAKFHDDMDAPPILIPADSELGIDYAYACELASNYALAGRYAVAMKVVTSILKTTTIDTINVHHNDYWRETVQVGNDNIQAYVVRKGATPLRAGERAYIGGSMTDGAAIVQAMSDDLMTLNSAPHGSGRVMSRSAAKGNRKGTKPGRVTPEMMFKAVHDAKVELRGGDLDESPFVYRQLDPVLAAHSNIQIVHRLRSLGVAMAPKHLKDPYRD